MARALTRQTSLALVTLVVLAALLAFYSMRGPGGVGGTGIDGPGGVGGTGIFGRIDRFGSIWVNNREIFYDDNLPLTWRGVEAAPEKFALGQMVAVVAEEQDGVWQASSARIVNEVIGPIGIARDHSMTVLDQKILFTEHTIIAEELHEAIEAGGMVAISGYRTPDSAIIATRIDPVGNHAELFVRGAAYNIAADSFSIGGLKISYEGLTVSEGEMVAARGAMIGAQFTAYDVRKGSVFEGLGLENISYQGVVDANSADATLRVGEYSAANASIVTSPRETGDYALVVLEGRAQPDSLALDSEIRASAIEQQFLTPAPENLRGLAEEGAEVVESPREIERREPARNESPRREPVRTEPARPEPVRVEPQEDASRPATPDVAPGVATDAAPAVRTTAPDESVIENAPEDPVRVERQEDAPDETADAPNATLREEDTATEPEDLDESSEEATERPVEDSDAPETTEGDIDAAPAERSSELSGAAELPEVETPEVERPDVETPEVERPEVERPERPEVDRPERPERPQRPNR